MSEPRAGPRQRAVLRRDARLSRRTPSTPTRWSRRLLADGLVAGRRRRRRRPRRREHVRVHRGGPPGVDRHHPGAGRRPQGRARSSWSPAAWPSATATSSPRRCPRSTRSSGSRVRARWRQSVAFGMPRRKPTGVRDLLELPRAAPSVPWAYVKVAEGCDRACAFCAIPSFRGKQRSRTPESIEAEVRALVDGGVAEIVLVAQDLAWYGRDAGEPGSLAPLLRRLDRSRPTASTRVRLLYLYPSEVRDPLVATMLELPTVVPYFDLSLQHADAALLRAHEAVGERRAVPRHDRRHPRAGARRRVPVVVHRRASRARTSASTTRCSRSSRRRRSTGPGSSRSRPRTARRRRRCPARSTPSSSRRVVARVRGGAGADHARGARRAGRRGGRGARRRASTTTARSIGRTYREAPEIDGVVRLARRLGAPGRDSCAPTSPRRSVPICVAKAAGAKRGGMSAPAAARAGVSATTAIATPANFVTIARLVLAVPTLLLIVDQGSTWLTVSLWFVLTTTDGLDGWLARRDGTTRSGAFLDPLADKFLVLGGFFALGHQRRLLVGRGDHRDRARGRHLDVPLVRGRARHLAARPPARQVEGVLPVPRGRRRAPSRRPTSGRRSTTSCCGSRSGSRWSRASTSCVSGYRQSQREAKQEGKDQHAV